MDSLISRELTTSAEAKIGDHNALSYYFSVGSSVLTGDWEFRILLDMWDSIQPSTHRCLVSFYLHCFLPGL